MMIETCSRESSSSVDALTRRLRHIIDIHFDPVGGADYWLDRAKALDIDPRTHIRSLDDLEVIGDMWPQDLQTRPLVDFIPKRFHADLSEFIVGQTGGTTGDGAWTAYREDEFEQAFIRPFAEAAQHVSFPTNATWLYIGPGGPHIIGKAAGRLSRATGSPDPFSVDFDPRWAKRLPEGSFAARRYLDHVIEQAMAVIDRQPIEVIFTTPIVLSALSEAMTVAQRERLRGVHYGGMALEAHDLERFQNGLFPNAAHLSGYGNTLFGCCMELSCRPDRTLDYFPHGDRLLLEVVDDNGRVAPDGASGRIRFTRLDESVLIIRMRERDAAIAVEPPTDAPAGFTLRGVRNPHSPAKLAPKKAVGLY